MEHLEESQREKFVPALFRGEKVVAYFRKILGHSVKCDGLGITEPWLSADSAYNTSKAACGDLVGSLLGGNDHNYVSHRVYVHGASARARKER